MQKHIHDFSLSFSIYNTHDDVIKWKQFPRNWPFVRRIHRSPVNSPHKGQWRGALMFSLIYARIHDWANNREAGDLRRHRAHYDVIIMTYWRLLNTLWPRQNDRQCPHDNFKCIFVNENKWILIKISLRFVSKSPMNNIPALVHIMAWRRPGDKS